MECDILKGERVRLAAKEPKQYAMARAAWAGDSEYLRLLTTDVSTQFSVKQMTEWVEKDQLQGSAGYFSFAIHPLDDDRMVGFISLDGDLFPNGEAWVGIGIGNREDWGKGYGTDAMRIILRFAFQELNLRRVSLDTFKYNPRAIRSYEKAGFVHEGRMRGYLCREGLRSDMLFMGILQDEWLARSA